MNTKPASGTLVAEPRPALRAAALPDFPSYTAAENLADRIVHLVGFASASVAVAWPWGRIGPAATSKQIGAMLAYSLGLVGMISASGLYNFARPGSLKAVLRSVDHSMIFVMIAGTYTPFTLVALPSALSIPLCAVVWALAVLGTSLKIMFPGRYEMLLLTLYLGMGWLGLGVVPSLWSVLPASILLLLLIGGVIYSLGGLLHICGRVPFHNAIWHAMVVAAAGFHLAAVAQLLPVAE